MWFFVVVLFQSSVFVLGLTKPETQCEPQNVECLTNLVKDMFQSALDDNGKDLDDYSVDPLHQELVEGNIHDVKYRLIDSTIKGFKDSVFQKVSIPETHKKLQFDLVLPHYEMFGNYKVEGKLLNLDIEGEGKYYLNASNVHLIINTAKNFFEKGGKRYLKLTNVETDVDVMGSTYMNLENLFNGNKELADPVLKFINENSKQVLSSLHSPVTKANMEKLVEHFNKILAVIPLEDIIIQNKP